MQTLKLPFMTYCHILIFVYETDLIKANLQNINKKLNFFKKMLKKL